MRRRSNRLMGGLALVAVTGIAAAAFQIDADIVTQVSTSENSLWVPSPATGEVVRVDVPNREVTARVRVGQPGADLDVAEHADSVVAVDRTAGTVSLVNPTLNEVTRTVPTPAAVGGQVDIGPEAIVVGSGTQLEVIDTDVTTLIPQTLPAPVLTLAADGPGALAETGSIRVTVDGRGAASQSESAGRLVRAGDQVYTVGGQGVVDRDGTRVACLDAPVAAPEHLVGSADGWVVAIEGHDVHVANARTGTCGSVALGDDVGALGRPVIAGGRIYVAEPDAGMLYIVDPIRGSFAPHDNPLGSGEIRMHSRADFVVAYDAARPLAAIFDPNGFVGLVDTSGLGILATLGETGPLTDPEAERTDGAGPGGTDGADAATDAAPLDAATLAANLANAPEDPTERPTDALVANFAFSAGTVAVGESVRFVDTSTGSPESWLWDFGDGTGDEGPETEKAWDEPGTYAVTLTVSLGDASDQISLAIAVVQDDSSIRPAADFDFSSSVAAVGAEIRFEDRSAGAIDTWQWDFGDGTFAAEPNVSKSWAQPGRYIVRLTVSNEQGIDSAEIVVEVVSDLREPVAEISVATRSVDLGSPLTFRASSSTGAASFRWEFGDGDTSVGSTVTHVFSEAGSFTVRLIASNSVGSSTAEVQIEVRPPTRPPIAAIATLPSVIEVGDAVEINSLSTNSPDTETWRFGDGTTAIGRQVTHTWTAPGEYLLELTATNAAGPDTTSETVTVVPELPAPSARIGAFDASPWVGEVVVFRDASIGATSWLWDFGDGDTSTTRDPLHTFTTPGRKVVRLTVSNRNGSDSLSVVVEPRLKPTAAFTVSPTAVRVGDEVTFTDASINATKWSWTFGDGDVSTLRNPKHVFTAAGEYTVRLTVENAVGDSDAATPRVISVDPAAPLLSGIRQVPTNTSTITTLEPATFEAVADPASGPRDRYSIDFGDGTPSATSVVNRFTHVFAAEGSYDVRMRARGPLGSLSPWVTRTFTVVDPPAPAVAISGSVPSSAQVGSVELEGQALPGSGPIDAWRWRVTRGASEWNYTGRTATHNFADVGVYTLQLTAEGPVTNATVSRTITITAPPPPVITGLVAAPSTPTTGVLVQFQPTVSGSVDTWEWDYDGAGYVAGGQVGSKIFNSAGPQTVRLRVTGPFGGQDVFSLPINVNPAPAPTPPVASPSDAVDTGTTVTLTSSDAGGRTGLTWDWKIRQGATEFNYADNGTSVTHRFDQAGSWTVTVTATDSLGVSRDAVSFVTVTDPAPLIASFTSADVGPNQVQFTDTSGPYAIDSWSWDFGDPGAVGNSSVADPTVTFSGPGTYSVTLIVTAGGRTDLVTRSVSVP